jgi:transposase
MVLSNGDTIKQLLARSRYILFKNERKWTQNQRAVILFELYLDIKLAYELSQKLSSIFENTKEKIY